MATLRSAGVICEDLPFQRAYRTPEFAVALIKCAAFRRTGLENARCASLFVRDRRADGAGRRDRPTVGR